MDEYSDNIDFGNDDAPLDNQVSMFETDPNLGCETNDADEQLPGQIDMFEEDTTSGNIDTPQESVEEIPEDTQSDLGKVNHPGMTLEEVQELQGVQENEDGNLETTGEGTGNEAFKDSLPEGYNPNEIELQEGTTIDDFNRDYHEANPTADNTDIFDHPEPEIELSEGNTMEDFNADYDEVNGETKWPDNDGAVEGTEHDRNLEAGEEFTRRTHSGTVNDDGSFAGEKDISFEESSLPGNEEDYDKTDYKVTEDMPDDHFVTESEVAPAFEQEGGGTQYEFKREHPWNPDAEPLDVPMQDMKDYGYIEEESNNK